MSKKAVSPAVATLMIWGSACILGLLLFATVVSLLVNARAAKKSSKRDPDQ